MEERAAPAARADGAPDPLDEPRGVTEHLRLRDPDDAPPRFDQAIHAGDVLRPLGGIGEVVLTLVLDRDLQLGVGEIDLSQPPALLDDVVVDLRLGEPGIDDGQTQPRLGP